VESAKRRGIHIKTGPLAVEVVLEAFEEQIGANIREIFTFYQNEKNIDVMLSFSNATGLMGDFYDRYKKNVMFAFPFRIRNHYFRTELAGGIVDERYDRLPINPRDFVCVQNWISVENGSRGIGLFSREIPVFHPGGIHYNKISSKVDYSLSSSVYLYAASNRTNSLNYCEPDDCGGIYHLSILPFAGRSADTLPRWSYEKLYPPLLGAAREKQSQSFLSIDKDHIRLLCFKKAENGDSLFLRLCETAGKDAEITMTLPIEIKEAHLTSGLEEGDEGRVSVEGKTLHFSISRFSYINIMAHPKAEVRFTGEEEKRDIKNFFSFSSEHRNTVVCFEKGIRKYPEYRILEGDNEITRVAGDSLLIQRCTLPGCGYRDLRVVPVNETIR
jgi:hypothetical protein